MASVDGAATSNVVDGPIADSPSWIRGLAWPWGPVSPSPLEPGDCGRSGFFPDAFAVPVTGSTVTAACPSERSRSRAVRPCCWSPADGFSVAVSGVLASPGVVRSGAESVFAAASPASGTRAPWRFANPDVRGSLACAPPGVDRAPSLKGWFDASVVCFRVARDTDPSRPSTESRCSASCAWAFPMAPPIVASGAGVSIPPGAFARWEPDSTLSASGLGLADRPFPRPSCRGIFAAAGAVGGPSACALPAGPLSPACPEKERSPPGTGLPAPPVASLEAARVCWKDGAGDPAMGAPDWCADLVAPVAPGVIFPFV